jgi:hypothetical protein
MVALHDVYSQVNSFRSLLQDRAFDTLIFDMCVVPCDADCITFLCDGRRQGWSDGRGQGQLSGSNHLHLRALRCYCIQ